MTRRATPASANVNLAFRVYPGWESRFPSYPLYFGMLFSLGLVMFVIGDFLFRMIPDRESRARAAA